MTNVQRILTAAMTNNPKGGIAALAGIAVEIATVPNISSTAVQVFNGASVVILALASVVPGTIIQ
jgi:hypothetical protein